MCLPLQGQHLQDPLHDAGAGLCQGHRSAIPCGKYCYYSSIVLASRASGHHLDTQTLKNQPSEHPNF